MKTKVINTAKGLFADLLFWTYLFSCMYFLVNLWVTVEFSYLYLFLAGAAAGLTSFFSKISLGYKIFKSGQKHKWTKTFWGWSVVLTLLLTFTVGWNIVEVQPYKFFTGFSKAGGITSGIFDPSIVGYQLTEDSFEKMQQSEIPKSVLEKLEKIKYKKFHTENMMEERLEKMLTETNLEKYEDAIYASAKKNTKMLNMALEALAETIFLALLATVLAIPFAFMLSFFAARNLMPKTILGNAVYLLIRTLATIFRSIEAIVWAIIFSVWVGIGPFAGMLALMIHSIAALTKLYSEQIENIDPGPVEAIKATGASTLQTWVYAVIPQIISPYLAFTIYRWDINVRMATIVGFVGGGGIGLLLLQQQQMLRWHNVGLIIWLIAAVVWIMDMVSASIREKLAELN